MLFQYIFRNVILLASSDNDKPMLMRQKENVNKDSPVGPLLIVTDFSKRNAVVIFRVKASCTSQNINWVMLRSPKLHRVMYSSFPSCQGRGQPINLCRPGPTIFRLITLPLVKKNMYLGSELKRLGHCRPTTSRKAGYAPGCGYNLMNTET